MKDGKADGYVRSKYKGFRLAILDKDTGSENGIFNIIFSFYANTFALNTTNWPDKYGELKLGEIKYKRGRDDTFIQYAWFAIRDGIGDIIGF